MYKCSCHMQDVQTANGQTSWYQQPNDTYRLSGTLVNGTRFKTFNTKNWIHANRINLYHGSVRLVREFPKSGSCPNNRSASDHTTTKVLKKVWN